MSGWSNAGDLFTRYCTNAQTLVIAAPYIKVDALSKILSVVNADASLTCVTKWTPRDIAVGASDLACRDLVLDSGGSFKLHSSLHAKFYRIDDVVLIGSANLTLSALGWSTHPNLEILCQAGDDFDSWAFQRQLLVDARELSDEEFLRWRAIVEVAASENWSMPEQPLLLDTWRPKTRDPRHVQLSYLDRDDLIASFDEQDAASYDLRCLVVPAGLSNEEFRLWITTCLLAAPFANTVIRLKGTLDVSALHESLADIYGLNLTDARRGAETVQNWLAFFAPGSLLDC